MIRNATEKDANEIATIYNHYVKNTVFTFEETEVTAKEIQRRINEKQASGYPWLVSIQDEQVVGYAYAGKWNERSAYRKTAEVSIYLSHEVTTKGLGTKLYEEIFSRMRKKETHILVAGITLPNPPSIALHEKFGMVQVAHFKEVGYKFGQWLDVGYWQVNIN